MTLEEKLLVALYIFGLIYSIAKGNKVLIFLLLQPLSWFWLLKIIIKGK